MSFKMLRRAVFYTGGSIGAVAYLGVGKVVSGVAHFKDVISTALASAASAVPAVAPAVPPVNTIAESLSIVKLAMNTMPWFTAAGCLYGMLIHES